MKKKSNGYQATEQTSSAVLHKKLLHRDSPFAAREAYNAIRTKLLFTGKGEKCPIFAVTSSLSHDGKTTNAVNLSVSIASAGKRVLLIDGDMRKPMVNRYFNLSASNGLSEILAGLTKEIHIRKTGVENLSVLSAGQIPPNPAELLGAKQMDTLLEYVKEYFDCVIMDTPPVNVVTDAAILAEKVTGYIFVVQSGKNHYKDVSYALETLTQMNGNIAGIILNDTEGKLSKGYGYSRYVKSYYRGVYSHSKVGYSHDYWEQPQKRTLNDDDRSSEE